MLRLLILYTALAAGANTALAGEIDLQAAKAGESIWSLSRMRLCRI